MTRRMAASSLSRAGAGGAVVSGRRGAGASTGFGPSFGHRRRRRGRRRHDWSGHRRAGRRGGGDCGWRDQRRAAAARGRRRSGRPSAVAAALAEACRPGVRPAPRRGPRLGSADRRTRRPPASRAAGRRPRRPWRRRAPVPERGPAGRPPRCRRWRPIAASALGQQTLELGQLRLGLGLDPRGLGVAGVVGQRRRGFRQRRPVVARVEAHAGPPHLLVGPDHRRRVHRDADAVGLHPQRDADGAGDDERRRQPQARPRPAGCRGRGRRHAGGAGRCGRRCDRRRHRGERRRRGRRLRDHRLGAGVPDAGGLPRLQVAADALEVGLEVGRVLIAKIPFLLERGVDEVVEAWRRVGIEQHRRHRCAVEDRVEDHRRGAADERLAAGDHLVQDHAEREDVGARVDVLAARLLGRHVGHGADGRARRRQLVVVARAGGRAAVTSAAAAASCRGCSRANLARPKSRIFTRSLSPMKMLAGLMSRWTMP